MSDVSALRALNNSDVINYNQHQSDLTTPLMSSFKSRKRCVDPKSSDAALQMDGRATQSRCDAVTITQSPYSNKALQRNGGKAKEAEIADDGMRHNRKSNVIRIDARDQVADGSIKRDGVGSTKRRQSSSGAATTLLPNDVRYVSPNNITALSPNDIHYASQNATTSAQLNDVRFASLSRTPNVLSKSQHSSFQSRPLKNQSEMLPPNYSSFSQSKLSDMRGLPRTTRLDVAVDAPEGSQGIPQGDTLPYTHRPRPAQPRKSDYDDAKARSRVTFASHDKHQSCEKPVQPIKKQQNHVTKPGDHKKEKEKCCGHPRQRMLCFIIILLILLLLVTICLLIFFTMTPPLAAPVKTPINLQPAASTLQPTTKPFKKDTTFGKAPRVTPVFNPPRRNLKLENVAIANRILSKLDNSVDPCQDFYSFACGGWLSVNHIPPGAEEFGVVSKIAEKNDRILHELLVRDDVTFENISEAEMQAKKFYASCLDLGTIERLGAQPLYDLLNSLGGWDALGNWDEDNWDLNNVIYECQGGLSLSVFFSVSVHLDPLNPTKHMLIIDQKGTLTLEDEGFYLGSRAHEFEEKFKRAIGSILRLLTQEDSQHVVDEVYRFEKRLAQIHVPSEQRLTWQKISIKQLSTLCPQIDWFLILHRIFNNAKIATDTEIMIWGPTNYFSDLSNLINNSTKRTLHNYVMWRIVFSRAHRLSLAFRRATSSLIYDILGIQAAEARWRLCLDYVKEQFTAALGMMYVKEHFSLSSKRKIEEMTQQIKETFQSNLEGLDWLDRPAKYMIKKQLAAATTKVGFKQTYLDDPDSLNKLYQFPVDSRTFFKNFIESVKFKVKKAAAKLGEVVDNSKWRLRFDEANGYYIRESNEMIFPAGLLQPPIFDPKAPEALNYGAIGSTIGHELIHAFDSFGNSQQLPAADAVYNNYTQRMECVVQKYHKFDTLRMAGRRTLFENTADMAGVKLAFKAYQDRARIERRVLPNYTNTQLFFISYAQTWCTKRSIKSMQNQMMAGSHSLEKYRVIGSLSQFDQFARAFSCRKNAPMNPDKKCSVW